MIQDSRLVDYSPIGKALEEVIGSPEDCWQFLREVATEDVACGAAIACLVGLAIGDAAGHPLEFTPVDQALPDEGGHHHNPERPCLLPGVQGGRLLYRNPYNKFGCKAGQWTDDTSMALCLADSLIVHQRYHGGDLRVRWHMWWTHGYCNAFRYDRHRRHQTSVGLGGNISKSLAEVERFSAGLQNAVDVTPGVYASSSNDAGNGSIMRLAAVPIALRLSTYGALDVAALSSFATHPGADAAACCLFVTYFVSCALGAHRGGSNPGSDVHGFVDSTVKQFIADYCTGDCKKGGLECFFSAIGGSHEESLRRLGALLSGHPPSPKEQNWLWKSRVLPIMEALNARHLNSWGIHDPKATYNGHPIIPAYFGSYCMDGLAMALWALWHADSFSSCIQRAVNLLGDADTIGAIAGQLAGAVYGWVGLMEDEWSRERVADLKVWDPRAEVGLRAALLYHCFPKPCVRLRQAEGHSTVRVFAEPKHTAEIVGELPCGQSVQISDRLGSFVFVAADGLVGWIGGKNIVYLGAQEFVAPCGGSSRPQRSLLDRPSWAPARATSSRPSPPAVGGDFDGL